MSNAVYPYRSGKQIRKLIGQFARVFSGFQVQDGVGHDGESPVLYRVPVMAASTDRVVTAMLNNNSYFKNNRELPIISVSCSNVSLNPQRRQNTHHRDVINTGNGHEQTERIIGVPIVMTMEVGLLCSSKDELYDLLEQIVLLFNPSMAITLSSDANNLSHTAEVFISNIQDESTIPLGSSSAINQKTLTFEFKTNINYPHGTYNAIIEQIEVNVNEGEAIVIIDEDTA